MCKMQHSNDSYVTHVFSPLPQHPNYHELLNVGVWAYKNIRKEIFQLGFIYKTSNINTRAEFCTNLQENHSRPEKKIGNMWNPPQILKKESILFLLLSDLYKVHLFRHDIIVFFLLWFEFPQKIVYYQLWKYKSKFQRHVLYSSKSQI